MATLELTGDRLRALLADLQQAHKLLSQQLPEIDRAPVRIAKAPNITNALSALVDLQAKAFAPWLQNAAKLAAFVDAKIRP